MRRLFSPAGLRQLGFEIRHVAIGVAVARCLAEADAVDDRGMVQGVGDDGVLLAEERLEHAAIGVETGGVEDGILHLHIAGDAGFELGVKV